MRLLISFIKSENIPACLDSAAYWSSFIFLTLLSLSHFEIAGQDLEKFFFTKTDIQTVEFS